MAKMLSGDSWNQVVLPMLEALLKAEQEDSEIYADEIRKLLPAVPERQFHNTMESLISAGFLAGKAYHEGGQRYPEYLNLRLLGPGRQAVGDWPANNPFAVLLNVLDDAINASEDAEERTRLERFKASALEVGQSVVTGVLTSVATQAAGLR